MCVRGLYLSIIGYTTLRCFSFHWYRIPLAFQERVRQSECGGYRASVHGSGTRGRPSFDISKEQLSFFVEQGFKVKDMSAMLGVSVRTAGSQVY